MRYIVIIGIGLMLSVAPVACSALTPQQQAAVTRIAQNAHDLNAATDANDPKKPLAEREERLTTDFAVSVNVPTTTAQPAK